MEVDDDDARVAARLVDERVDLLERIHRWIEEERAEQVDHGDAVDDDEPATRCSAREVRRTDHALRLLEICANSLASPDVVAQRHDVGAGRKQLVRELRRDSGAVGDVLAVDDAEVDAELFAQRAEPLLDSAPPGRAEHVGEKEKSHLAPLAAAGRAVS